jgi:triphosphatase
LKSGDEAALHALADELRAKVPGLAPDDVSKAQRGYRLREQ